MLEAHHIRGIERLDDFVSQFPRWRCLTDREMKAYPLTFVKGWNFPGLCHDPSLHLRLLVDADFPFSPPRVAVSPPPSVLTWPNLEEGGILCLLQEGAATSTENVDSVALELLKDAQFLVNECLAGNGRERFEDEFVSYWDRWPRKTKRFISLCDTAGPTRWVYACSQNAFTIVAETEEAIKSWLSNHYGKKLSPGTEKIPFVLLDRPLHPEEYPKFVANLFCVIHESTEANRIVQEYLCYGISSRMKILLGFPGRNGFAFAGLVLPPYDYSVLQRRSPRTPMEKLGVGFRNGKMRPDVLLQRYCSVPLKGAMVQRCDPSWVHGRGHNPDTGTLMQKTVVMVGTGSLGSGIVELLAKMGTGKVILVDPENLQPENASRHSLGVSPVPVAKVVEMAKSLRHRFPHLEFVPHVMGWNRLYDRTPQVFTSADLIVSTVGSWTAEGPLNIIAKGAREFPPVLFGWLEEHASAGHAVALFGGRGCLHCMMNHRGQVKTPVTRWPEEGTLLPIPMCGGMFQPYGAIELSHVQALVADLAADILLGRVASVVHRAWIGQQKLVASGGGQWNRDWTDLHGNPGDGGRMMEVPFRHNAACPVCKELR